MMRGIVSINRIKLFDYKNVTRVLSSKNVSRVLSNNIVIRKVSVLSKNNENNCDENVVDILKRLETSFKTIGNSNSDKVLADLKLLHNLNIVIPLTYLIDAATLFTGRNDFIRTEILLRLSKENHLLNSSNSNNTSIDLLDSNKFQQSSRSKPLHNAYDKLVSYSINNIMKYGNSDAALKLWVGMGNTGYMTSRITLEKLLEGAASSTQPPNLEFIKKVHDMIKINIWDQNPKHYYRLLGAMRQHLRYSCDTIDKVETGLIQMDTFWNQYNRLLNHYQNKNLKTSIETISLKIQCYISAIVALKRIDIDATNLNTYNNCLKEMMNSYDDLIGLYSQPSTIKGSVDFLKQLISKIEKSTESNSTFTPNESYVHKHYDFTNSAGQFRSTTLGLLESLAEDGKIDEVMKVLSKYLKVCKESKKQKDNSDTSDSKLDLISSLSQKFAIKLAKDSKNKQKSLKQQQIWGENEIEFIDNTFSHILQTLALNATNNFMDNFVDKCEKINKIIKNFENLAATHDIELGNNFHCAWIKSLGLELNMTVQTMTNEPRYHQPDQKNDYDLALIEANRIVTTLESSSSIIEKAALSDSIVTMLCSYGTKNSIDKAISMVKGLSTQIDDVDSLQSSKLITMLTTILNKSVTAMPTENDILQVSNQVDAIIENFRTLYPNVDFHNNQLNTNAALLNARFCVYVRLRKGYQALKTIRVMRLLGLKVEKKYFNWVIIALHKNRPLTEPEWRIAKNPDETCEWILREMQRDGHKPNSRTVSLMLRLYGKNCQIKKSQGQSGEAIDAAFTFLNKCKDGGFMGLPKIPITDEMISEVLKICLLANDETKALKLLDEIEIKYGLKASSVIYEPLIYYYAGLKGAMTTTEDFLVQMINKNIPPTTAIVDALIAGFLMEDDVSEALDRIQELYTEHRARPSVRALIRLLELSLIRKDEYEARRVVVVIQQMYSFEERNTELEKGKVHVHPDEYEFVQSRTSENKMKRLEKIMDMTETLENRALSDDALRVRFIKHQINFE